jgi:hypothetical protein
MIRSILTCDVWAIVWKISSGISSGRLPKILNVPSKVMVMSERCAYFRHTYPMFFYGVEPLENCIPLSFGICVVLLKRGTNEVNVEFTGNFVAWRKRFPVKLVDMKNINYII